MSDEQAATTFIYPVLGGNLDLWFARVAGHGLGNSFHAYFHAVVLAEKSGAALVTPPWFSLKIGPLLRGSASKRHYWGMFKPGAREIHGVRKLCVLLANYRQRVLVNVDGSEPVVMPGALNFLVSRKFTFHGLHAHRSIIRERLLDIVNDPIPPDHRWGQGDYSAVHVRLGDFAAADHALIVSGEPNLRIPLSWYANMVSALRRRYGARPVYIFSDGEESTLRPLLDRGATLYRSGSDMTDLLAMSGASVLVGSNSTYSRWAAFLGNMPSIWLQTAEPAERPAPETPILYIPLDAAEPMLWE